MRNCWRKRETGSNTREDGVSWVGFLVEAASFAMLLSSGRMGWDGMEWDRIG
jgi:hypothetical protein